MLWDEKLVEQNAKNKSPLGEGRVISYTQALREALSLKLAQDPSVFLLGQGVDDPGGMFGVTRGLHEEFGAKRVFDTPVSEEGMTGVCTGAAMMGMRPVYFHNRPDFLLLAFNQIVNHASKIHFMDAGKTNVPMVIWSAIGRGWGSGPQHSQAIQGLLLSVPGLKIAMPSTPYDAKGLLIGAIEDNNPVIIIEHRWLMKQEGVVPEGHYTVPFGKGVYRRRGEHLTIVGTSQTLQLAMAAADQLQADQGVTVDVIDLRTVKPLDEAIIIESLAKTGKLLVVDTGWSMGGVCAEVGCLVAEKAFHLLKAPIRRIGLPDVPSPAGYTLEQYYYPTTQTISETIKDMVGKE